MTKFCIQGVDGWYLTSVGNWTPSARRALTFDFHSLADYYVIENGLNDCTVVPIHVADAPTDPSDQATRHDDESLDC